jgi:2-dehydro-3-deoxyphosphogluconate aldolase/(4S)-4-hydroxy-2-oxoglutarate aldolase
MEAIINQLETAKVVPVVKLDEAKDALPLGNALLQGGLPIVEITFRTGAAADAIASISSELPDICIGAGTVLTIAQVNQAIDSGARFIVAPGFNPRIVDYCIDRGIPVFPGVNSPSQVEMGLERDLQVLKFFPAEASGGLKMLKAMAAPYSDIRFMPTGGINIGNLKNYLAFDRIIACGGTWLATTDLINEGRFDEITRLIQEVVRAVQ